MSLLFNGVEVTAPKSFKVNIVDLDGENTKRNGFGKMRRDRLRVLVKLECEWGPLTNEKVKKILQNVSDVEFPVTYPDPQTGRNETRIFYVGDRSIPAFDFESNMWLGMSFNLIEI